MCTESKLSEILTTTYGKLSSIFGSNLENVLLYGSYARGEQTPESDIDVIALVDMPKDKLCAYKRRVSDFSSEIDLQYDVLLSIKLQDIETFNRYRDVLPFYKNVLKEGIRVVQ